MAAIYHKNEKNKVSIRKPLLEQKSSCATFKTGIASKYEQNKQDTGWAA